MARGVCSGKQCAVACCGGCCLLSSQNKNRSDLLSYHTYVCIRSYTAVNEYSVTNCSYEFFVPTTAYVLVLQEQQQHGSFSCILRDSYSNTENDARGRR